MPVHNTFYELLTTAWETETWIKYNDGKDEERKVALAPILADEGFTIIDLLIYLGLDKQADYYSTRWTKHDYE